MSQIPLMFLVQDTYKKWTSHMRTLALDAGIPDSYRSILPYLLRYPGSSQKALASYRGVTTASINQAVKEMQAAGYLRKETDDTDQRFTKLYLTETGEAVAIKLHERIRAADERIKELLTSEKEETLRSILAELSAIIIEELPKC